MSSLGDFLTRLVGLKPDRSIPTVEERLVGLRSVFDGQLAELQDAFARAQAEAKMAEEELREELGRVASQSLADVTGLREQIHRLERLVVGTADANILGQSNATRELGTPAVAVVLPTFNRARFVGEAIQSVVGQSFSGWELVIVDDGSVDETESSVRPFLADARIRYIRQENRGVAAARNVGIRATTAPLIAYLDDDNLWYPSYLSRAAELLSSRPDVDLVYGALATDLHHLDGSSILWRPFDRSVLEVENFIDTNVMVHRRRLVDEFGPWDEGPELSRLYDWEIAVRYTQKKPGLALDVLAARYRERDDNRITRHSDPNDGAPQIIRRRAKEKRSAPGGSV